jgi:hypothetical protein
VISALLAFAFIVHIGVNVLPRILKREWWRPNPTFRHDLVRVAYRLVQAPFLVGILAVILAVAGTILYGVVWVLHAMWRAT